MKKLILVGIVSASLAGIIGLVIGTIFTLPTREKMQAAVNAEKMKTLTAIDTQQTLEVNNIELKAEIHGLKQELAENQDKLKEAMAYIVELSEALQELQAVSETNISPSEATNISAEFPVKPQYNPESKYKLQMPTAIYPQVYERDFSQADESVRRSYYSGIVDLPKGTNVIIKSMKFCNRTNSWWLEVHPSEPTTNQRLRDGWINNDTFIEYPLIDVTSSFQ